MDVLECIDCDSNDGDVSEVAEDGFSIVSNDFVCESSYKSDGTISSSTTSASVESYPLLLISSHSSVSLFSVLKPPTSSEYSHKRKIAKNPPVGKKGQIQIIKAT